VIGKAKAAGQITQAPKKESNAGGISRSVDAGITLNQSSRSQALAPERRRYGRFIDDKSIVTPEKSKENL
jgi:hypothetical protein